MTPTSLEKGSSYLPLPKPSTSLNKQGRATFRPIGVNLAVLHMGCRRPPANVAPQPAPSGFHDYYLLSFSPAYFTLFPLSKPGLAGASYYQYK
ncbi:hypothetical protein TgHK011_009801 [Trichoderma gracile]|nr:hypothetical protein TgHK011_009801 [Trichoderma gracile]